MPDNDGNKGWWVYLPDGHPLGSPVALIRAADGRAALSRARRLYRRECPDPEGVRVEREDEVSPR